MGRILQLQPYVCGEHFTVTSLICDKVTMVTRLQGYSYSLYIFVLNMLQLQLLFEKGWCYCYSLYLCVEHVTEQHIMCGEHATVTASTCLGSYLQLQPLILCEACYTYSLYLCADNFTAASSFVWGACYSLSLYLCGDHVSVTASICVSNMLQLQPPFMWV